MMFPRNKFQIAIFALVMGVFGYIGSEIAINCGSRYLPKTEIEQTAEQAQTSSHKTHSPSNEIFRAEAETLLFLRHLPLKLPKNSGVYTNSFGEEITAHPPLYPGENIDDAAFITNRNQEFLLRNAKKFVYMKTTPPAVRFIHASPQGALGGFYNISDTSNPGYSFQIRSNQVWFQRLADSGYHSLNFGEKFHEAELPKSAAKKLEELF